MAADEVEDVVLTWLTTQNAVILQEVFGIIPLDCPTNLHGKKRNLLKTLLDHFCTLNVDTDGDGGHSTMLSIQDFIKTKQSENVKEEIKEPMSVDESVRQQIIGVKGDEKSVIDLVKFKEFKISGTIAGKGDNKLSYTSLLYQIEEGRRQKYSEHLICAAIVKSISPASNLRTYLESRKLVSLDSIIEILRSHFKEKDSSAVFTELSNAVQQTNETCLDFVIRLLCLREKVLCLSIEEKCPYDEERLRKTFFHTMFTGMRNVNIRNELRANCRNDLKMGDELLMKLVSESVANEAERNEKFVLQKKSAAVNVINIEQTANPKESLNKKNPFSEIEKLKATHLVEISELKAELSEIRNSIALNANSDDKKLDELRPGLQYANTLNNRGRGSYRTQFRNSSRNRCSQCITKNLFRCNHCFKCGSTEHRMSNCYNTLEKNE